MTFTKKGPWMVCDQFNELMYAKDAACGVYVVAYREQRIPVGTARDAKQLIASVIAGL